jgi:hypothetical protein
MAIADVTSRTVAMILCAVRRLSEPRGLKRASKIAGRADGSGDGAVKA